MSQYIDHFINGSKDEVYGSTESGSVTEETLLNPRNPYAATKASAYLLALSYNTTHNLPVIVTQSSNNYVPRQHRENLIPKFVMRGASSGTLLV